MPSASKYDTMQPQSGKVFPETGHIYEQKFDGIRTLAGRDEAGVVEIFSREHNDLTLAFPELKAALERIPHHFVLDGETCILINERPSLGAVRSRIKSVRRSRKFWRVTPDPPANLFAFDLLELDGVDYRGRPIEERKAKLRALLKRYPHPLIRYVEHTNEHGLLLLEQAHLLGMEGIICKKKGSRYVGKRSDLWLKFKVRGYQPLGKEGQPQKPQGGGRRGSVRRSYRPTGQCVARRRRRRHRHRRRRQRELFEQPLHQFFFDQITERVVYHPAH